MIVSLVTLLIILFVGGGPDSFFLVPNGQKMIKTNIVDQAKSKDAVVQYKASTKAINSFNKQNKKDRKELVKLQGDRNTQRSTLENIYKNAFSARKQLQEEMADARLKIRDLMTQNEWDAFIADALVALEKEANKTLKADVKVENSAQESLDKISEAITAEVKDEQRQMEALEAFAAFEETMLSLVRENSTMKFNAHEPLLSYTTNHDALIEIYNKMNSAQDEAFDAFLDLREELVQDITDEEWKSISKSLKLVF